MLFYKLFYVPAVTLHSVTLVDVVLDVMGMRYVPAVRHRAFVVHLIATGSLPGSSDLCAGLLSIRLAGCKINNTHWCISDTSYQLSIIRRCKYLEVAYFTSE